MMGLLIFAAGAANAPVMLARADETQWRLFVRASLQRPAGPSPRLREGARLMHLQGVVQSLDADRARTEQLAGPSGL
jgi:hypothetical protein